MDNGEKWDLGRRTEKISTGEFAGPDDAHDKSSVPPASFRRLGMWLLLASLGMLFGASLIGFLILRARADQWPPSGTPPMPARSGRVSLWV